MTKNHKQSSRLVTHLAAKVLNDPNASLTEKKLAGSVLSQSGTDNQTGKEMQTLASAVLRDPKSTEVIQTLAGSVVSQSTKDR